MGEAPGLRGYFVCAGLNSVGIASAGGAGRALAEWIVEGEPTSDLVAVDIRRFGGVQRQQPVAEGPGGRGARPALRRAVAEPRDGDRAAVPLLARARPAGRRRRVVRLEDGLGAAELLRSRRRVAGARLLVGPAVLAAVVGRGAPGHPRGGRRVRPDVVLQVRRGRPGRARGAAVGLRERRRRRGRAGGLHAAAEPARRLRVRPDGHPAPASRSSCWSAAPRPRSATSTGSAGTSRTAATPGCAT